VPVHVWLVPHVVVVTHARHPFCVSHVCTPPGPHCLALGVVHVFVQHDADPGAPVHAPPVHACDAVCTRHESPSDWLCEAHVISVEPLHCVPVVAHAVVSHEQAAEPAAPVHASFAPHVFVPVTLRHEFESLVHVASVVPLSQTVPATPVQLGSLLHVHDAEPAAPEHTWSEAHATGVPYAKHPLVPAAHVARPPVTHSVCPAAHVPHETHAAVPLAAEHAGVGDEHVVDCAM